MGRAGGVSVELLAPRPLSVQHQLAAFDSGEAVLDDWLKRRALANHVAGASRVFVVADAQGRVYGYYALAAGAVSHKEAIGAVRRNMPDPVPVMVLGRLAVDVQARGRGLGAALLQDAVRRSLNVAENAGVRALLVHALHDKARAFYEHYGSHPTPVHALTLMLRLSIAGLGTMTR